MQTWNLAKTKQNKTKKEDIVMMDWNSPKKRFWILSHFDAGIHLCSSHLQSQSELYHVSWWYYTLVIDLIGQLCRDVIGRLSVKLWCYWLWRLVISNWCVSIRIFSQLNSCLLLVTLSLLWSFSRSLLDLVNKSFVWPW